MRAMPQILSSLLLPPMAWPPLLACLLIVLAAGVVRGFAGFGFSAITVAACSLFMSPAQVVPAIFMLEVAASLSLLYSVRREVNWPWLSWLIAGNALCIPLGVALLAWVPEMPLRLMIGLLLLLSTVALRSGFQLNLGASRGVRLLTGLVSGVANGLAAIGGIAVAVMLNASAMPAHAMRATLIALFLFTDLYALASAALLSQWTVTSNQLISQDNLRWALWMSVPMLSGIWIGQRLMVGIDPEKFRLRVLDVLLLVCALVVLRTAALLLA